MADREIENVPAKYKSKVWQYFGFEKTVDNGVKSVNKTKTVCKVCQSDISYAMGTTTYMFTHLQRKHPLCRGNVCALFFSYLLSHKECECLLQVVITSSHSL